MTLHDLQSLPDAALIELAATRVMDIPGFPGYRAGIDGSIWKHHTARGASAWKRMQGYRDVKSKHSGLAYIKVTVYDTAKKKKNCRARILVALAHMGPTPDGMEVTHKNGDGTDNRVSNLEWKTHVENMRDKLRHGTQQRGSRVLSAKVTESDVIEIRQLNGVSPARIAEMFGLHPNSVRRILNRQSWTHL